MLKKIRAESSRRRPRRLDVSGVRARRSRAAIVFGRVVRAVRTRRGLSQEALASRARLTSAYVADIERGLREPNLVMLFKLADALGVEPSELIGRMERLN